MSTIKIVVVVIIGWVFITNYTFSIAVKILSKKEHHKNAAKT